MSLIWIAYLLIWLVVLPVNLLSVTRETTELELHRTVLSTAANSSHPVAFVYGLATAWFLFLYLYRSRSANFFGSLPLRRETQFATHCLAGLLSALVPNFLVMGAIMLAGAANGFNLIAPSAVWFLASSMTYVFYFSLAVCCAMLVGNLVAMPLLYVVVNFAVVVVEACMKQLLQALLYGFWFTGSFRLGWLSPFYYFVIDGNGIDCRTVRGADGELESVIFSGWEGLLILTGVGVVLLAAAFLLHRNRRMEVAGDVIAVKSLRPVFRYVFTFGCMLVGGTVLAEVLVPEMTSAYFVPIALCLLGCTVAGFFLSEMILLRTLRVFRKRNFLQSGICVVLAVVFLICVRLDVLGLEQYVPDTADVAAVRLQHGVHDVTDPARIQQVLELHQEILDRKEETEAACRQEVWTPRMDITYVLQDGSEVCRYYRLPVWENEPADPGSLMYKYDALNNTPEMILSRELPEQEITARTVYNCVIYYMEQGDDYSHTIDPSAQEAAELWKVAMLPDLQAGNMGTSWHVNRGTSNEPQPYSEVSVEFEIVDGKHTQYYYYPIPETAVHTMRYLIGMGVPEGSFHLVDEDYK